MSSTEDSKELKAGHPPAVKAGGMRITRPRQTSTGDSKEAASVGGGDADEGSYSTTPPKAEKHNQKVLISGAVTVGDRDFTPDAIKQYHDKPIPGKEKRQPQTTHHIQQPK